MKKRHLAAFWDGSFQVTS